MFFSGSNKNYLNKHKSLMFNGYKFENNKESVFKYSNKNILTKLNEKNYYKNTQQFNNYSIVVNTNGKTKLNRNTDFRKKYFGHTSNELIMPNVNDRQTITIDDIIEKPDENIIKNDSVFDNPQNKTTEEKVKQTTKEKGTTKIVYETDKEIKTTLSFDRWQSSNDIFNHIKEVEKKLEQLKKNMENSKKESKKIIKREKNEKAKKIIQDIFDVNSTTNIKHPYKKISKTFIEGDSVQICWTPNKWVDGMIDEITVGGLYYVRHMTERENNADAEMTWTRSLVNPNQIRRK